MRCGTCYSGFLISDFNAGDNRPVDFSQAMIFMTSNLGASEMSALSLPNWASIQRSEETRPRPTTI